MPQNSPARNRVLVIDDDPGVREMFQRSLALARFDVVVAGGGVEGLRMLRADATIGLVLLDLMMPTMNGREFRRLQLGDPSLADIPTVIVTRSAPAPVVQSELQAADYLQKPVTRADMLNVVAKYCNPLTD